MQKNKSNKNKYSGKANKPESVLTKALQKTELTHAADWEP